MCIYVLSTKQKVLNLRKRYNKTSNLKQSTEKIIETNKYFLKYDEKSRTVLYILYKFLISSPVSFSITTLRHYLKKKKNDKIT